MTKAVIAQINIKDDGHRIIANHMQREQATALKDLMKKSFFRPLNDNNGPYDIDLSIQQGRLVLAVRNNTGQDLNTLVLSIKPYKRLIEDYFMMIRSHEHARKEGRQEKLEAIDMGRRGLHNEGAELLIERLKDKVEMDFETARRFFTLICVLHEKHVRLLAR